MDVKERWRIPAAEVPWSVSVARDGSAVAFGSWDKKLHVLDAAGQEVFAYATEDFVKGVAVGPGATIVVAGSFDKYLYALTKDPEHLRLARLFDHRVVFDPLARGEDALDGLHANTQIPKALGAERDCALTGEARYCRVAETFWKRVANERSYVVGGHSEDEHFFPVAHFSRHLGESTAETCNTYNMLKLTRALFLRDRVPARVDFYERGLFNHILASNDPASGEVTYYVPMKPGAFRTYSTREDSFWCCVGTGMENPARFGEAIYARSADALYVNLFIASELRWPEQGLRVRQLTRFPQEEGTRLEGARGSGGIQAPVPRPR